jgi:uncharacterized protein
MRFIIHFPFLLFFVFSLHLFGGEVHTLYGTLKIENSMLRDVIESDSFTRLKHINQYGLDEYLIKETGYTRYIHSLGVFVLAYQFGADIEELVAALLHDASHTACSHLADWVFYAEDQASTRAFQDEQHIRLLHDTDLPKILERYNISLDDINHKSGKFKILEQSLPDICADRLEYNLYGGVLEKLITEEEVHAILSTLRYENERWYFTDTYFAKKFAEIPLYHTTNVWSSPREMVLDYVLGSLMRYCFMKEYLTVDHFCYATDAAIWKMLGELSDKVVQNTVDWCLHVDDNFEIVSANDAYDLVLKGKFRGINPWVLQDGKLVRLTDIDQEFSAKFNNVKRAIDTGCFIKLLNKPFILNQEEDEHS